jgi:hypothetical protein
LLPLLDFDDAWLKFPAFKSATRLINNIIHYLWCWFTFTLVQCWWSAMVFSDHQYTLLCLNQQNKLHIYTFAFTPLILFSFFFFQVRACSNWIDNPLSISKPFSPSWCGHNLA